MRDIKFRVWDTKNKCFLNRVAPLSRWLDTNSWDDWEELLEDPWIYPKNVTPSFDNRLIWQQFTGLYDKSGKEIYEGDIIKQYNEECKYEVMWAEAYSGWQFCLMKVGCNGRLSDFYGGMGNTEYCEVIGNTNERD